MRKVYDFQASIDRIPLEDIDLYPNSRDDTVGYLEGFRAILLDPETREAIIALIHQYFKPQMRTNRGRPGMDLLVIILLAGLKHATNCDYDRLTLWANELTVLRQMMGHGSEDPKRYSRQCIHDNVSKCSVELLEQINALIVKLGHRTVGKTQGTMKCRSDSKVVKTNVHYPTDLSLLWDSTRCLIRVCILWSIYFGFAGWRQHESLSKKVYRAFQRSRKGRSVYKIQQVQTYLGRCEKIHKKATRLLDWMEQMRLEITARQNSGTSLKGDPNLLAQLNTATHEISLYLDYVGLFSDQIVRRILQGETISHQEKVFSIFKPFTRWIVKGKAGILQELGVPVAVVEDAHQFVLGHGILWNGTDKDIAVRLMKQVQERFPEFRLTCSFDRSFYSPGVRDELDTMLAVTAMSKKGGLTRKERVRQSSPEYKEARQGHSGVESCMNNLNHRRMDVVREVSPEAFERAIALSVLGANIHRLGVIIRAQERERRKRQRRRRAA